MVFFYFRCFLSHVGGQKKLIKYVFGQLNYNGQSRRRRAYVFSSLFLVFSPRGRTEHTVFIYLLLFFSCWQDHIDRSFREIPNTENPEEIMNLIITQLASLPNYGPCDPAQEEEDPTVPETKET